MPRPLPRAKARALVRVATFSRHVDAAAATTVVAPIGAAAVTTTTATATAITIVNAITITITIAIGMGGMGSGRVVAPPQEGMQTQHIAPETIQALVRGVCMVVMYVCMVVILYVCMYIYDVWIWLGSSVRGEGIDKYVYRNTQYIYINTQYIHTSLHSTLVLRAVSAPSPTPGQRRYSTLTRGVCR